MVIRLAVFLTIVFFVCYPILAHAESISSANMEDMKLLYTIMCEKFGFQIGASGDTLALYCQDKLQIWNVQTFEQTYTLTSKIPVYSLWGAALAISLDGRILAEWAYEDQIYVWDTQTGAFIGEIPVIYNASLQSGGLVRFSSDGQHAAVWRDANGDGHNQFEVWSVEPFQREGVFTSEKGVIIALDFSADSTQVFTLTDQGVIEQWEIVSGNLLHAVGEGIMQIFVCGDFLAARRGSFGKGTTLIGFDLNNLEERWSEEFDPQDFVTLLGCNQGQIMVNHESYETGPRIRLWDMASGEEHTPAAPIYSQPFTSYWMDWLRLNVDGSILMPPQCGSCAGEPVPFLFVDMQTGDRLLTLNPPPMLVFSAAEFTEERLIVRAGQLIMIYGIPTDTSPAFSLVPGYVVPSDINLREAPSLNSEVIGFVENGYVLVSGRDESGNFLYLENVAAKELGNPELVTRSGWVNANRAYIDLGDIAVNDLPVKN